VKLNRYAVALFLAFAPMAAQQQVAPAAQSPDLAKKAPAVVFILRHGEKPMDKKSSDLTEVGFRRAAALPTLFLPQAGSSKLPRLPRPNAVFASAHSKNSNRPVETITPLAKALNLPLNQDFDEREVVPLADQVLGGKYAGKVVIICWHHGEIPHMAKAFGVTDAPKQWDDTVFDQIWMIEWIDGKPQFSVLPEHLLPGDK